MVKLKACAWAAKRSKHVSAKNLTTSTGNRPNAAHALTTHHPFADNVVTLKVKQFKKLKEILYFIFRLYDEFQPAIPQRLGRRSPGPI